MMNYRAKWTSNEVEEMHLMRQVYDYASSHGGLILDTHNDFNIAFPKKHIPVEIDDLMSITRAAWEVGCSRRALYMAITKKELPAHQISRTNIAQVSLSEVINWYKYKPGFLRKRKKES